MSRLEPPALDPAVLPEASGSGYPEPFRRRVAGKHRRRLGDALGLKNFGVNLTRLDPGIESSMRHAHSNQDELIYVIEGEVTLVTDAGRQKLGPGMVAGFPAGSGDGHQLVNETGRPAVFLEVGDRTPGDEVIYSDIDMVGKTIGGRWTYLHKDGKPYPDPEKK